MLPLPPGRCQYYFDGTEESIKRQIARISLKPPGCRFEFDKRRQFFIRVHNETLSVVAMCDNFVGNGLMIIHDRSRSRAAHLDLRAHFVQSHSKRFNLLLLLGEVLL
jgi:hypothetical protein